MVTSPHPIFAAALTKDPTAPELLRGVLKVLSVHSIGNPKSTPPFSYYLGNDFSTLERILDLKEHEFTYNISTSHIL